MFRRFARTIDIEVSPEEFVYRYGPQERRVPTRGYIRKVKHREPSYLFEEQPTTEAWVPVSLFSSLPPDAQEDIVDILAAFLTYGVGPLCTFVRPIIVFTGVERFGTGFGFEHGVFREAAKLVALDEKEVYFRR